MTRIKDIRNAFIGKHFSFYDSWNGSREWIKINDVKKRGSNIEIIGLDSWDHLTKRIIDANIWIALFTTGIHETSSTIDHCDVVTTYKIV